MLKLKFAEFMAGQYSDNRELYQLYIVRDESQVLYVGMSQSNIYNRWFNGSYAHINLYPSGKLLGISAIGAHIVENRPRSNDWTIELMTVRESAEFAKDVLAQWLITPERCDACYAEKALIRKCNPSFNS